MNRVAPLYRPMHADAHPKGHGALLAGNKEIPYFTAMVTSRLTSKSQTTIPQAVRRALDLREGDELAYAIEGGRVVLTKAAPVDDPFALFDEWNSEADRVGYADL